MADTTSQHRAEIVVSGKDETREAFNQIQGSMSSMKSGMEDVKSVALGLAGAFGVGFGIQQFVGFMRESVTEAVDAERAHSRLSNTLAAFGVNVENAMPILDEYFSRIGKISRVTEDEAKKAFANLIGIIGGDIPRAVDIFNVALNIAVDQEQDLTSTVNNLALALQGGQVKLQTIHPFLKLLDKDTFDAADSAGKLKMIMDALPVAMTAVQREADTTGGKINQLSNSFANFQKSIGNLMISAGLPKVIDGLSVASDETRKLAEQTDYLTKKYGALNALLLTATGTGGLAVAIENWFKKKPSDTGGINLLDYGEEPGRKKTIEEQIKEIPVGTVITPQDVAEAVRKALAAAAAAAAKAKGGKKSALDALGIPNIEDIRAAYNEIIKVTPRISEEARIELLRKKVVEPGKMLSPAALGEFKGFFDDAVKIVRDSDIAEAMEAEFDKIETEIVKGGEKIADARREATIKALEAVAQAERDSRVESLRGFGRPLADMSIEEIQAAGRSIRTDIETAGRMPEGTARTETLRILQSEQKTLMDEQVRRMGEVTDAMAENMDERNKIGKARAIQELQDFLYEKDLEERRHGLSMERRKDLWRVANDEKETATVRHTALEKLQADSVKFNRGIFENMKLGFADFKESTRNFSTDMIKFTSDMAYGMRDSFRNTFVQGMMDDTTKLKDLFRNVFDEMERIAINKIATITANMLTTGAFEMAGGIGSVVGSFFAPTRTPSFAPATVVASMQAAPIHVHMTTIIDPTAVTNAGLTMAPGIVHAITAKDFRDGGVIKRSSVIYR